MKNKHVLITIIVVLVVGAGSFFGGMQYQKMQQFQTFSANGGMRVDSQRALGTGGNIRISPGKNFGPVIGEIIESDDKSITVKLEDGSSKIVVFSESTPISKSSDGTKSDLKAGEKIAAFGTTNSDGSVTAQNIQLNPQMRMMQARPSGTPAQ